MFGDDDGKKHTTVINGQTEWNIIIHVFLIEREREEGVGSSLNLVELPSSLPKALNCEQGSRHSLPVPYGRGLDEGQVQRSWADHLIVLL